MPMDQIVPSLCIAATMSMDDEAVLEDHLAQIVQLEEDHFVVGFHQHVEKDR